MSTTRESCDPPLHSVTRLGVVSFLNARPLVQGLESDPRVSLHFDVPAKLAGLLDRNLVDVALVPAIDWGRRAADWQVVSDACIGSDGETLTVRVFSRVPASRIRVLHVDGDSHTSVALATVLWKESYGTTLTIKPYRGNESIDECEAILLIGDKVVTNTLVDYELQIDLGAAWKSLASLPFVFALWAAPRHVSTEWIACRLAEARDAGVRSAEMIAADFGPAQGFPVEQAKRYLSKRLRYTIGPRYREGLEKFLGLARKHGLITATPEPAGV